MYKITNTSRGLAFAGLYPGESRKVFDLDSELIKLSNKGLIDIQKIENKTKTSKEDEVKE